MEFVILVVVGMCCVLSCLEAGFLLIVGVGGRESQECALLVGGMDDMLCKTTPHTHTLRRYRKSGVFGIGNTRWEGREITGSLSLELMLCLDFLSCTVVSSVPLCLAVDSNDNLTQNHP